MQSAVQFMIKWKQSMTTVMVNMFVYFGCLFDRDNGIRDIECM